MKKEKRTFVIIGFIIALVILSVITYFVLPEPRKNDISAETPANLTYVYCGKNIKETLTSDETETLARIFNGRREYRHLVPACGFDADISVSIDGMVFAPACDTCSTFKNVTKGSYFDISVEEMDTVRRIFEKYGGTFPCV